MKELLEFLSFSEPNIRYVAMGTVLLGAGAAVVGCFTFLRKRALVGDAIAHSILPGICLAFLISGSKNPLVLLAGAIVTGWLSLLAMDLISRRSKLKTDTAIGLVLSVFFGLGIMLLTAIQNSGNAAQSGLDKFLFGKAASLTPSDSVIFGLIALFLILIVVLFFKEFKLISFNPDFAKTIGLPVKFLEFTLSTITVMSVASGIQAVGVVLMAALLITPAASARYWTDKLLAMILLAAFFGAFAGLFGSFISYTQSEMPTGPWIVVCLSLIAFGSILIGPKNGVLSRHWQRKRNYRKILVENILKIFYHLGEKEENFFSPRTAKELFDNRELGMKNIRSGLNLLRKENLVIRQGAQWVLTAPGLEEGKRIVRLHRLWELYLTRRLKLPSDHIHNDAEAMEHLITPEIEALLQSELENPEKDPHNSKIPY